MARDKKRKTTRQPAKEREPKPDPAAEERDAARDGAEADADGAASEARGRDSDRRRRGEPHDTLYDSAPEEPRDVAEDATDEDIELRSAAKDEARRERATERVRDRTHATTRAARPRSRGATADAAAVRALEESFRSAGADRALWLGVLGPPMLLLLNQQVNYMLVPWTCRHDSPWALHLVSLVLIVATVLTGLTALRYWRAAGPDLGTEGEGPVTRGRFMALVGIASSALGALMLFSEWLPILYITPCRGV